MVAVQAFLGQALRSAVSVLVQPCRVPRGEAATEEGLPVAPTCRQLRACHSAEQPSCVTAPQPPGPRPQLTRALRLAARVGL